MNLVILVTQLLGVIELHEVHPPNVRTRLMRVDGVLPMRITDLQVRSVM